MTTTNENRRRIYRVPHAHIFGMMRIAGIQETSAIVAPRPLNLPEGTKVCSVQSNYEANAFDFVAEHESFAVVPEGTKMPVVKLELELFHVANVNDGNLSVTPVEPVQI